eukprot:3349530-Pleurochrysis_carterae.AAC.3
MHAYSKIGVLIPTSALRVRLCAESGGLFAAFKSLQLMLQEQAHACRAVRTLSSFQRASELLLLQLCAGTGSGHTKIVWPVSRAITNWSSEVLRQPKYHTLGCIYEAVYFTRGSSFACNQSLQFLIDTWEGKPFDESGPQPEGVLGTT